MNQNVHCQNIPLETDVECLQEENELSDATRQLNAFQGIMLLDY